MVAQIFLAIIISFGILLCDIPSLVFPNLGPRTLQTNHVLLINEDTLLSKRAIVYKIVGDELYFLGYDGYGIYNKTTDSLKVYYDEIPDRYVFIPAYVEYTLASHIYKLSTFEEFSDAERKTFSDMIQDDNDLKPISNYYAPSSENTIIDLDEMIIISIPRNVLVKNTDVYLYDRNQYDNYSGDSFMKIDTVHKIITSYRQKLESDSATTPYVQEIIEKIKERYQNRFVELNSIDEFSKEDIIIFKQLKETSRY